MTSPGGRLLLDASATVDAGGGAVVAFGPSTDPMLWIVEWLIVQIAGGLDANPDATAAVYVGQGAADHTTDLVLTSIAGALDTASEAPPLVVWPGESLRVVFAGADPADTATVVLRGRYDPLP